MTVGLTTAFALTGRLPAKLKDTMTAAFNTRPLFRINPRIVTLSSGALGAPLSGVVDDLANAAYPSPLWWTAKGLEYYAPPVGVGGSYLWSKAQGNPRLWAEALEEAQRYGMGYVSEPGVVPTFGITNTTLPPKLREVGGFDSYWDTAVALPRDQWDLWQWVWAIGPYAGGPPRANVGQAWLNTSAGAGRYDAAAAEVRDAGIEAGKRTGDLIAEQQKTGEQVLDVLRTIKKPTDTLKDVADAAAKAASSPFTWIAIALIGAVILTRRR